MLSGNPLKSSTETADPIFAIGSGQSLAPPAPQQDSEPKVQDFQTKLNSVADKHSSPSTSSSNVAKSEETNPDAQKTTSKEEAKGGTPSKAAKLGTDAAPKNTTSKASGPVDKNPPPSSTLSNLQLSASPQTEPKPATHLSHALSGSAIKALENVLHNSGSENRSEVAQGKLQELLTKWTSTQAQSSAPPASSSGASSKAEGGKSLAPPPTTTDVAPSPGKATRLPAQASSQSPAPSPSNVLPVDPQGLVVQGQAARALAQVQRTSRSPETPNNKKLASSTPLKSSSGTDGANSTYRMHGSEETSQDRPATLQSLPGKGNPLPSQAGMTRQQTPGNELSLKDNQLNNGLKTIESPFLGELTASRLANDVPVHQIRQSSTTSPILNTIEQIQLRIVNGAMELRAARADSMSVVLRPDNQTEMTIHLKIQNGLVDVEAKMHKGDFTALQAQWGQLQQSLSNQGVRLASLQPQNASDHPGQESSDGNRQAQQSNQEQNSKHFQDRPRPSEQDANNQSKSGNHALSRAAKAQSHPHNPSEPNSPETIHRESTKGFWESWA